MSAGSDDATNTEAPQGLAAPSFERLLQRVPAAFAITSGREHTLIFANAAFRTLVAPANGETLLGQPLASAFAPRDAVALRAVLDRAFRTSVVARNRRIEPMDDGALPLICSVWPELAGNGDAQGLIVELRAATQGELTLEIQREVAERLLLSALREQDSADAANAARRRASFLAVESRRLAESLDEGETLAAMERMSLPYVGDWCFVDTLDDDGIMHRLAIIHPDPAKQIILEEIEGRWTPEQDDEFGLPAALRHAKPVVLADYGDEVFGASARDPHVDEAVRQLGVGPLLTVPLVVRDRLIGAVTFVSGRHDRPYTPEDIQLAEDLANRSATALDRARAYGEAIALKVKAESASEAKSAFLGMMSHELRTPLNAIGGYVDLIDLELHGPVTDAQRVDLGRIRSNQLYLMGIITDLLNLTRVDSGNVYYTVGDINVAEMLAASIALVEPLIAQRHLIFEGLTCEPEIVARGDREKVIQILVNLLSNALKFTPAGGRIGIHCEQEGHTILISVKDTGIGIPNDKLQAIFEPFIQVKGRTLGPEAGVGLGLSISRGLAREMRGDLSVDSTFGAGSCFTLALPASSPALRPAE
ncbi:MAG: ATP-binding region ATPase domain protein [Gemmatimonadetes bacterium]|jgi:signal transduction histidine kinase|nr:ATP-binding region ATPase domain protein [Gemmatimonadota bacterium]